MISEARIRRCPVAIARGGSGGARIGGVDRRGCDSVNRRRLGRPWRRLRGRRRRRPSWRRGALTWVRRHISLLAAAAWRGRRTIGAGRARLGVHGVGGVGGGSAGRHRRQPPRRPDRSASVARLRGAADAAWRSARRRAGGGAPRATVGSGRDRRASRCAVDGRRPSAAGSAMARRRASSGAPSSRGAVLGGLVRPPIAGIVGHDELLGLRGAAGGISRERAEASPIATHSASAFAASMRPPIAGATGRGSAGTLGGPRRDARRRRASSRAAPSRARRARSCSARRASTNRSVMPTRPCSADGLRRRLHDLGLALDHHAAVRERERDAPALADGERLRDRHEQTGAIGIAAKRRDELLGGRAGRDQVERRPSRHLTEV